MTETKQVAGYAGTGAGVFARVYWCGFGPALWLALVYAMYDSAARVGPAEVGILGLATSLVFARVVEWKSGGATTLDGEATTPAHLKRYTAALVALTIVAWIAAKALRHG